MTLARFAEENGINYRTAQTWLRRGRIEVDGNGFSLNPPLNPPGDSVNPSAESFESSDCAELRERLAALESRLESLERKIPRTTQPVSQGRLRLVRGDFDQSPDWED